jgi:hypothetical protein
MYRPNAATIVIDHYDHDPDQEPGKDSREMYGLLDIRRRSASSPGPQPPGRIQRMRGLTISEMGGAHQEQQARAKIRGFGVAAGGD